MKTLLMILLCLPLIANACKDFGVTIDKMILRGELSVTFNADGTADEVTCNSEKLGLKECEHLIEHVYDYYHKNKKG